MAALDFDHMPKREVREILGRVLEESILSVGGYQAIFGMDEEGLSVLVDSLESAHRSALVRVEESLRVPPGPDEGQRPRRPWERARPRGKAPEPHPRITRILREAGLWV